MEDNLSHRENVLEVIQWAYSGIASLSPVTGRKLRELEKDFENREDPARDAMVILADAMETPADEIKMLVTAHRALTENSSGIRRELAELVKRMNGL